MDGYVNVAFMRDRLFATALVLSLAAHILVLSLNTGPYFSTLRQKDKETVEVKYLRETAKRLVTGGKNPAPLRKMPEPFLRTDYKITVDKRMPPPLADKDNILRGPETVLPRIQDFTKPALAKPDIVAVRKKISLPPIDTTKINNPNYISYYQIVREKIKRAAYQNYTGKETGEVTISFVISKEGYLKELSLIEEKSSFSPYLREIALRSVKEASGFPVFPKELDYPQLSFNLAITFEIE